MEEKIDVQDLHYSREFTILSGQTVSNIENLKGSTLVLIQLPAAFTGTQLRFQSTAEENPATAVFDTSYNTAGDELTVEVGPSRAIHISVQDFAPVQFLKIVSNAPEAADRTIKVLSRRV